MPNVLFSGRVKDTMIENIEVPKPKELVYYNGKDYFVAAIMHFPQGGAGIPEYKKYKKPFTRITLS